VTGQLNQLRAPDTQTPWQLDFSSGHAVYRELTADAA
jgi:hypothetical protein